MSKPAKVDSKVVRGKAAFHTLVPALAFLVGYPIGPVLVGATGALMAISVIGGPRYSLFGRLFRDVLRPALKISPGRLEEAAPHRLAETFGAIFLLAAALALATGAPLWVGWGLTLMVSALASLNWLGGICVVCQMYPLFKRLLAHGRAAA